MCVHVRGRARVCLPGVCVRVGVCQSLRLYKKVFRAYTPDKTIAQDLVFNMFKFTMTARTRPRTHYL